MKKGIIASVLLLLSGCSAQDSAITESSASETTLTAEETVITEEAKETAMNEIKYYQLSQDEAEEMMNSESGYIILDVRRADEFAEGHIPDAVNIPNEEIGTEMPQGLPDKTQLILVYCRSGRRSKEAAAKLSEMGYTNIYEFGGILEWTGEIVR